MSDDLDTLGITALKEIARAEAIAGYSKFRSANKHELAELIRKTRHSRFQEQLAVAKPSSGPKELVIPRHEFAEAYTRLYGKPYVSNSSKLDEIFYPVTMEWFKTTKPKLNRGDFVVFEKQGVRKRKMYTLIFDGYTLVDLDFDHHDYGAIPSNFFVGAEFPLNYWNHLMETAVLPIDLTTLKLRKSSIVMGTHGTTHHQLWQFETPFGMINVIVNRTAKLTDFPGPYYFYYLSYDPAEINVEGYDPNITVVDPQIKNDDDEIFVSILSINKKKGTFEAEVVKDGRIFEGSLDLNKMALPELIQFGKDLDLTIDDSMEKKQLVEMLSPILNSLIEEYNELN